MTPSSRDLWFIRHLVDVLRFRMHLTADVSKMYRMVSLADSDEDLHRFL